MDDKDFDRKARIIKNRQPMNSKRAAENPMDNPLSIQEEGESIKLTGTTAASDMNFYFDQVKSQNNE